ncbi:MAG: hypothetical protein JW712_14140 [Dehalococcoidales bacterium]|nr:hypothetical protein [Dehalococcoidales bacterium]
METYVDIVEPLSLLIGSFLALWVSFIYRKQLKASFTFLSIFLLVYAVSIILLLAYNPILQSVLEDHLDKANTVGVTFGIQLVNYVLLGLFCFYLLKSVSIRKLSRGGWILLTLTTIFCLLFAFYPEREIFKDLAAIQLSDALAIVVRVFDALLIIALTPVIWLYIQYLRSEQQQSLTFTVIISGIVCATVFDYLFQFILALSPALLSDNSVLVSSIPEALFIFGYLIIAVGLYAHRKQDEWGYQTIDKMMSGDFDLDFDMAGE